MRGVPLLSRMVDKKVRDWTSGQSLPVWKFVELWSPLSVASVSLVGYPWEGGTFAIGIGDFALRFWLLVQSQTQPTKYSADPVFVVYQLSLSCGSYTAHCTLSRENKLDYSLLTLYITMFFLRVLRFPPLLQNQHLQIPIRPGIWKTKKNHF